MNRKKISVSLSGLIIALLFFICNTTAAASDQSMLIVAQLTDQAALVHTGVRPIAFESNVVLALLSPQQFEALNRMKVDVTVLEQSIDWSANYVIDVSPKPFGTDESAVSLLRTAGLKLFKVPASESSHFIEQSHFRKRLFFDAKPWERPYKGAFPRTVQRSGLVEELINQVDSDSLFSLEKTVTGVVPAIIGGTEYTIVTRHSNQVQSIAMATQFAYEQFVSMGYDTSYHEFSGPGSRNVIAIKTGDTFPDAYYMVCAHLDDMPPGELAPGADDNASGSTCVLTLARLLADIPSRYSIIFALWTGEEQGLYGSYYYARDASNQNLDIRGVLNFDMIAWDAVGEPVIELHAHRTRVPESVTLAEYMNSIISLYGIDLTVEIQQLGISASDHASFWYFDYPAILAIEDFEDFTPYYHTTNDQADTLNMTYFTNFVKAGLATVVHLAVLDQSVATGDIDQSGRVDGIDLMMLSNIYGAVKGESDFDENMDFNEDGVIDDADVEVILANFGKVL